MNLIYIKSSEMSFLHKIWLLCIALITKPTVFFLSTHLCIRSFPSLFIFLFIALGPRQTPFHISKAGPSEVLLILSFQPFLIFLFASFLGHMYRFYGNCFIVSRTYFTYYCEGKYCVLGSGKAEVCNTGPCTQ